MRFATAPLDVDRLSSQLSHRMLTAEGQGRRGNCRPIYYVVQAIQVVLQSESRCVGGGTGRWDWGVPVKIRR